MENSLLSILEAFSKNQSNARTIFELRQISENEQVNELATNKSFERIALDAEGLVQKVDPVYKFPKPSHFLDFRTHFYAPYKYFCGKLFPTDMFNVGVIWIIALITAIVLRFRLLRWVIRGGK
ncbi:MAG TPA: hypothetical protein PKY12_11590 [Catalimonadaceae bacterium]|nr:hypothetical protein [Catalimonadaceae bacterium]